LRREHIGRAAFLQNSPPSDVQNFGTLSLERRSKYRYSCVLHEWTKTMQTTALGLLLVLGLSSGASAQEKGKKVPRSAQQEAQALSAEGVRYYNLGDFTTALEKYKAAYLASGNDAILFNVAQCQRQLEQFEEALRSYRVFLQSLQRAPETEQDKVAITATETFIAEIEALLRQKEDLTEQDPPSSQRRAPDAPQKTRRFLAPGLAAGAGAVFGGGALLLGARVTNQLAVSPLQARLGLGLAVASDLSFAAALGLTVWTLLRPRPDEASALVPVIEPGQASVSLRIPLR
jgi:tetratricopeptide (TPR) repeat protein